MSENNSLMDPQQLKALVEVGQAINSISQKEPLLQKVLDIATEAIQAERGFLLLRNDATHEMRIVVARTSASIKQRISYDPPPASSTRCWIATPVCGRLNLWRILAAPNQ